MENISRMKITFESCAPEERQIALTRITTAVSPWRLMMLLLLLICIGCAQCSPNNNNQNYNNYAADQQQQQESNRNETFSCCSEVFGSCRSACKNLSLVSLATGLDSKDSGLSEVRRHCPAIHTEFWKCLNVSLDAISKASHWSGRPCCGLGSNDRCQGACVVASSRKDLQRGCRQSDEHNLFNCLDLQEQGERCCSQSKSADCMQSCNAIFRSNNYPTQDQRDRLQELCGSSNPRVLSCVKDFHNETPLSNVRKYLPCCDLSPNPKCHSTCIQVLQTVTTTEQAVDQLIAGGCGPLLPHQPMWQCFVSPDQHLQRQLAAMPANNTSDQSRINRVGMDSAKLHCCHLSLAPKCRHLCQQTFSTDWVDTFHDFELNCLTTFSEPALRKCIEEVEEPCELGCDGLNFCTNFNGRPTELFRGCTPEADSTARAALQMWQSTSQILLPGLTIPLKNISRCAPSTWKAVACTLHIKPCNYNSHSNQICREDCYNLLNECLDWTQLLNIDHSAASLCSRMSPSEKSAPCISLRNFLSPGELADHSHVVKAPCRQNPCENQVCQVDASRPAGYKCVPGCPLGEASNYLVPVNSFVRIPVGQKGCLKICRCHENGHIEDCQPLPCISYDTCNLAGRTIAHGSWFYVECNVCSCFAGEITCTKKTCRIGLTDASYTSFPCNCPAHYVPVCGKNGKTYPSACIAKCNGLQDFEYDYGACELGSSSCHDHDCPAHSVCVPERSVCLSAMHRPCAQYQCVNISGHCHDQNLPVCDLRGKTHSSLCHLIRSKETLAYQSPCQRVCNNRQVVCGINGVTYRSECEAWSDFASADYSGPCQDLGLLTATLGPRCTRIKCSPLPTASCLPIIPPGACCPVCSGSFRVVYSRKQIDRALYALNNKNSHLLTQKSVLRSLSALIRTSDCRLSGFLTIEADIFVTVQSTLEGASEVQIEACHREAEKIANLISTQSHRITSDLSLSALTVANMMQPEVSGGGGREGMRRLFYLPIVLFVLSISVRGSIVL